MFGIELPTFCVLGSRTADHLLVGNRTADLLRVGNWDNIPYRFGTIYIFLKYIGPGGIYFGNFARRRRPHFLDIFVFINISAKIY